MGHEGDSVNVRERIREYQKRYELDIIIKRESGHTIVTISDRARHVTAPYSESSGCDMDTFICRQIAEFLKWGDDISQH